MILGTLDYLIGIFFGSKPKQQSLTTKKGAGHADTNLSHVLFAHYGASLNSQLAQILAVSTELSATSQYNQKGDIHLFQCIEKCQLKARLPIFSVVLLRSL